ncbi:MAG: hypothetical protein J6I64_03775 [Lachnospiraceae bacterium]|nr:hypothetical protein [Lachnospiraceae bacterium]
MVCWELLLFWQDGVVEGGIQYFWIPEDRYLQLNLCNVRDGLEQALTEWMAMLAEDFSGYTLYAGFPGENGAAVRFLEDNGFQCIESDWNHSFFFDNYEMGEAVAQVSQIRQDNFDDLRAVYRPDEMTYWTCDRILESLDDWHIYMFYEYDQPLGTIFLQGDDGYYEIFGMELADSACQEKIRREEICRALLRTALNECKKAGAKYLTYLCGEELRTIVSELGFRCVGQYVCYIKEIEDRYILHELKER